MKKQILVKSEGVYQRSATEKSRKASATFYTRDEKQQFFDRLKAASQ